MLVLVVCVCVCACAMCIAHDIETILQVQIWFGLVTANRTYSRAHAHCRRARNILYAFIHWLHLRTHHIHTCDRQPKRMLCASSTSLDNDDNFGLSRHSVPTGGGMADSRPHIYCNVAFGFAERCTHVDRQLERVLGREEKRP